MKPLLTLISFAALFASAAFADDGPKFEVAEISNSTWTLRPSSSGPFLHGSRYEIRTASLVDLIRIAWATEPDKIVGGPSWLEFDRFDITAKLPTGTKAEDLNGMLQRLLADRFQLKFHKDEKPFQTFALTATANPKLKPADGSGDQNGCGFGFRSAGPAVDGVPSAATMTATCRNSSLSSFANVLPNVMSMGGGPSSLPQIVDNTGLTGMWDFELNISVPNGPNSLTEALALEAIEKQLGLKLERKTVPLPVMAVDSASRKPSPNVPDVAKLIPAIPTEFDVAEIKATDPSTLTNGRGGMMMMVGMAAPIRVAGRGGPPFQNDRVNLQGMTMRELINLAWSLTSNDQVVNAPKWFDTDHWDLVAKAPHAAMSSPTAAGRPNGPIDIKLYLPMIQALLKEKFKLEAHFEDRPGTAWVLTATKAKLQKSDPAGRTKCSDGPGPDGKDPRKTNPSLNRLVYCQNISIAEFADLLPNIASGYVSNRVADSTGLEGSYDFILSFSGAGMVNGGGRGGDRGPDAAATASDPSGGLSLADALAKQLGLKLEQQKRPAPVLVIDHVEPKPIDN